MTVYPIAAALNKADDMLGKGRVWVAKNNEQRMFVPIFNGIRDEARLLPEIKSIASRNHEEVNEFLAGEGYSIKLDPFQKPTDFGIASVLDLLIEWLKEGQKTKIVSPRDHNAVFPAVFMTEGVSFARSPSHDNIIAVLETKSGDQVCMTVHNRVEGFELLERANDLARSMGRYNIHKGLYFPQVDLDQIVDISWLKRLRTTAEDYGDYEDYEIAEALQQTKFRMNENGCRTQSGVALGVRRVTSAGPRRLPPLYIDEPFLVWILRKGLTYPLFTGWISEENWKTPKDISKK